MIRGVADVRPIIGGVVETIAQTRAETVLRQKLFDALKGAMGETALAEESLMASTVTANSLWSAAGATAASVAEKMLAAVRRGSFNKAGRAFKIVCRQLGIRHTYRDIRAYLEGQ